MRHDNLLRFLGVKSFGVRPQRKRILNHGNTLADASFQPSYTPIQNQYGRTEDDYTDTQFVQPTRYNNGQVTLNGGFTQGGMLNQQQLNQDANTRYRRIWY